MTERGFKKEDYFVSILQYTLGTVFKLGWGYIFWIDNILLII